MDQYKIEFIVKANPPLDEDKYADSVVDILTPPGIFHPIKRYKFFRNHSTRVRVVMAEYARSLINEFNSQPTNPAAKQPTGSQR